MEAFLTAEEAGKILHTSGAAVRRLIRLGQLPAARVGKRWLIDSAALRAFVLAAQQGAQNTQKQV